MIESDTDHVGNRDADVPHTILDQTSAKPVRRRYFSIVCLGRTGSTFLQRLLDAHPEIESRGEDISPFTPFRASGLGLTEYVASRLFQTSKPLAGFKMPWDFIFEIPEVWATYRDLDFRLIHLKRRNKLDHYLSLKLAQENQSWNSDVPYAQQKVTITPEELKAYISSFAGDDRAIQLMSKTFPTFVVYYEDIVSGKEVNAIQDFLGVQQRDLRPHTRRMRVVSRRDAIANFDNLRAAFTGTEIARFFDEMEHIS